VKHATSITLTAALTLLLAASAATAGGLNKRVQQVASENPEQVMNVIVSYRQQPGARDEARVQGKGGKVKRRFKRVNAKAVSVPGYALESLANDPNIAGIALDHPVGGASIESTPSLVSAVRSNFAGLADMPYSGAGVGVAVIDSGYTKHPDLKGLVILEKSFISGERKKSTKKDRFGHGNHVISLIAGSGKRSDGLYAGVAPEADLISLRVLDDRGMGLTSDVIAALDWVLENKDYYNIRVVNLSLGHPVVEAAADDPLVQAVEALWRAGVVVVCSAGNAGREGYGTITSPGNSSRVITVGSVTSWGDNDSSNDIISTYSSRGPTRIDRFAKPDLLAHGNRVVGARAKDSYMQKYERFRMLNERGQQKKDGEYMQLSGTSMSAAVVSGTVALMLEQDSSLSPDTVKARLMRSAQKTGFPDPFATGAGVLDIEAVLYEAGSVRQSPSPRVVRDLASGRMGFEKTSLLWGGAEWSLAYIWPDAYIWSDTAVEGDAFLWSDGYLWNDGYSWNDAFMWSDGYSWNDAFMWSDAYSWNDAFLWADGYSWADSNLNSDSAASKVGNHGGLKDD
jgi:serine protease AprX